MFSGRRSTRHELPSEIWYYISQFLTDDQLRLMYSVNRTFYRIAMRLRYHEMSIGNFYGPEGLDTLRCYLLSNTFFYHIPLDSGNLELVQHVRSLKLKPTPVGDLLADARATVPLGTVRTAGTTKRPPAHRLLIRMASFISRRATRQQGEEEARRRKMQMAQKLQDFVRALQHLTKLTIHWDASSGGPPDLFDESAQLLIKVGWQTYGPTLRILELTVLIETCEKVFLPSLQLDNLESLTLWLEKYYINTDDSIIIQRVLAPFVRKHSQSLKELAFNSFQNLDMTVFFDGIGYLPLLERLHIQQPYCGAGYTHSHTLLLHRYTETLTEFSWSFLEAPDSRFNYTRANIWFEQPPYHVVLPNLKRLKLGLWGFPLSDYFNGVVSYAGAHSKTLTKLALLGWAFNMMQFHELVNAISSPSLTELEISLEVLSSAAILHIATNFPQLRVLHLSYVEVGRHIWDPSLHAYVSAGFDGANVSGEELLKANVRRFQQDMESLTIEDWPLDTLFLLGGIKYCWIRSATAKANKSLLRSLPRVGFVNGHYREDFLKLCSRNA